MGMLLQELKCISKGKFEHHANAKCVFKESRQISNVISFGNFLKIPDPCLRLTKQH